MNHGAALRGEAKFTKLVFKIKELVKFICKGDLKSYITRVMEEIKVRAMANGVLEDNDEL